MNSIEKNTLAQEISLYLFAKYEAVEIQKKMNLHNVLIPNEMEIKRKNLTDILKQEKAHVLANIQREENIRPSVILTPSETKKEALSPPLVKPQKIFISHSKKDLTYVQEIINVLETTGIKSHQIFCSSYEGYGTPLGANYLEVLKEELKGDTLVLFVLSNNFFNSNICLCEMGAVWILTQDQIPLYIPPFSAEDVKGVFPTTQGIYVNQKRQLIMLKERLEKEFDIQNKISHIHWDQQIDRSLKVINNTLQTSK
ncbi:toll/interleukin-1 receptor domain-containing protein [Aquimarina sp. 2201CG1-2-11]|uniref:toll/interleukin-1 receptor domain-containing protein n=1 Tax=Aquimarina discodermiae TaxID=3231043 RepID=UPI0034622483